MSSVLRNQTEIKNAFLGGGRSSSKEKRNPFDNYATPACATDALLDSGLLDKVPTLEPACGDGYIVKVLRKRGFNIEASDLRTGPEIFGHKGRDFLARTRPCQQIVTNPPFSFVNEFINKGSEICQGKMALLVRLTFFEGPGRFRLLEQHKPAFVLVLSQRLPYQTAQGEWKRDPNFSHAWIVWDFANPPQETILRMMLLPHKNIEP